ncbi:MAG: AAA family ATPase [Solirubrobacteraceae bacterium]
MTVERAHYAVADVFVVGGQPTVTYTGRADARVGKAISRYLATRPGKMIVVTGPSKAGKTVLIRHLAPTAVHVTGGEVTSLSEFWNAVGDHLPIWTSESASRKVTRDHQAANTLKGGLRTPIAELGGEYKTAQGKAEELTHVEGRERSVAQRVKSHLIAEKRTPLFLDDFHHIDPAVQKQVVRALKDMTFKQVPIILAAVPHRVVDVVTREKEMKGRVETHAIVPWGSEELIGIAASGFGQALNVECPAPIATRLARESFGSPHLMQDLCLELAVDQDVLETVQERVKLRPPSDGWDAFFRQIAERNVVDDTYRSLKSGPRERSDRIPRPLKSGGHVDTYELILTAIRIALGRAVEDTNRDEPTTLTWTEIRPILGDLLSDKVPAWHEVKRALNKMDEIAHKLAASADPEDPYGSEPVLVFEPQKELVHITDPFFLFQLRWHV